MSCFWIFERGGKRVDKQNISRRKFLKSALTAATSAFFAPLPATISKQETLEGKICQHQVGDETVNLKLLQKPGSYITYFNMHDDENTAVKAAEQIVKQYGGRLIELKHRGTRNIKFNLDGKKYEFDPNRVFSEKGIEETLRYYGNYSEAAHKEVSKFRDWLLKQYLDESKVIITVHNNTNESYSILWYQKGGKYESDAKKVNKAKGKDSDNFFFVTKEQDYNRLANLGFNVVLQNNEKVKEDGSLSVYWGRKKQTPYINVEAQHNHLDEQVKMLIAAIKPYILKPNK